MISLVLYGRNDNYGYNLHKRAALSLNCMAQVLTHPNDEILFVDYNTPDDYPTFPETISDTLSDRVIEILRIFRVRPNMHEAHFGHKTHLKALEPISRNVAVRRSNPANRWVLSTNTDMIFVPRTDKSLSNAVAELPKGFYCAPRFEIPETLWEGFNRLDPMTVIENTRQLGEELHLNEIVESSEAVRYDGPGDFQLIERQDLFDMHGFDEDMLLGWHVDSNISKRLKLIYNEVGDAVPFVFGYHCDHTRQITIAHAHNSLQNDYAHFVDHVNSSKLPNQAETWGLVREEIEELNLKQTVSNLYQETLSKVIPEKLKTPTRVAYNGHTYDTVTAYPMHILPFLLDIFASYPRNLKLFWLGQKGVLFDMFSAAHKEIGFIEPIKALGSEDAMTVSLKEADAFIFNWGVPEVLQGKDEQFWRAAFDHLILQEKKHIKDSKNPRRIVCVNAIHNRFEALVVDRIVSAKTPFSTRIRHGYINQENINQENNLAEFAATKTGSAEIRIDLDWSYDMIIGSYGVNQNQNVITSSGKSGSFIVGPFKLPTGEYLAKLKMSCHARHASALKRFLRRHVNRRASLKFQLIVDKKVKSTLFLEPIDVNNGFQFPLNVSNRNAGKEIEIRLNYYKSTIVLRKLIVQNTQWSPN